MSCIHLHLGQAGIQLGESFWRLAEEEFLVDDVSAGGGGDGSYSGRGSGRAVLPSRKPPMRRMRPRGTAMFHEDDGWARCLVVDSEPKVVQRFQGRVESLRPENAIYSQSGLANNWAMGFASCRSDVGGEEGPFSRCMEGMRKEAERSCWLNSAVMTHSLAGGTGSGVGSGLLQALRDEYPSLYLISACVGPFGTGDTPLQHYNSALALQHLQAYADCVIYRGNDDLLRGAAEASARISAATSSPAASDSRWAASGGPRSGGGAAGWRPVGLLSRHGGSGGGGGGGGGGGASARGRMVVSTADMNASLSLDMASYFFPTSRPFDRFQPAPPTVEGRPRSQQQQQQQQQQQRQEMAQRPFDGGSLMAAAVPLPAAKFVDLRSTLSAGPLASGSGGVGQGLFSSSSLRSSSATKKDWAALANDHGRKVPLCPRRAGGLDDDACVAAHHLIRGATFGAAGTGAAAAARNGGGISAGRSLESNSRRRRSRGGGRVGGTPPVVASAVAAGAGTMAAAAEEAGEVLRRHHECQEWRTASDVSCAPALRSQGVSRSVTTVCNQTRIRGVLRDVVKRAEGKFRARAYLHWYYRHGLEDEDFLAAFEGVRTVERGYDGLARAFGGSSGSGEARIVW
ncbi:unnamed protein product [Ectocarpus sp. 8 AP-2014]